MLISRTLLTAMMGASVLMSFAAKADSVTTQDEPRRERIRCEFPTEKGGECRAEVILRKEEPPTVSSVGGDDEDRRARLRVVCNGTVVYSDGAEVKRRDDVIIVKAIPAPPVLVIQKHDLDHDRDTDAVLVIDDIRLRGMCEKDHDDGDDNGPRSVSSADFGEGGGEFPFPHLHDGKGNPFPFPIR